MRRINAEATITWVKKKKKKNKKVATKCSEHLSSVKYNSIIWDAFNGSIPVTPSVWKIIKENGAAPEAGACLWFGMISVLTFTRLIWFRQEEENELWSLYDVLTKM